MGISHNIRCHHCGHTFTRNYGVGGNGQGTMYCILCGRAQLVDFSGGWGWEPTCECGGTFEADAMGRCPKCCAMLTKDDINPNEPSLPWD
jgi:hypothetical protein